MASKGPKPWQLTEDETFGSFCKWQSNMLHCLKKEDSYKRFLHPAKPGNLDTRWERKSSDNPCRGFIDDVDGAKTKKEVKVSDLTDMLSSIAQWVPHYLSHEIIDQSTNMDSVWQCIRQYYNFQQSEVHFIQLTKLKWESGDKERPERLYRRILAHLHDNLLKSGNQLHHNKELPTKDEDISPTVERLAVLRWMELIDSRLPQLVACQYAADLQTKTLKDIQPQIVSGLEGLLEKLRLDDVHASRAEASQLEDLQVARYDGGASRGREYARRRPQRNSNPRQQRQPSRNNSSYTQPRKQCRLCQLEGRSYMGHSMGTCRFLSPNDKMDIVKSCRVDAGEYDDDLQDEDDYYEQE